MSHDGRSAFPQDVSPSPRHAIYVRVSHWLATLAILALVVSGVELIISHPRFYWGETGNVNTTALFSFPIPSSRGTVPTGYSFTLPDQNGWSRSLHFQSAWLMLFVGAVYLLRGVRTQHVQRDLIPARTDRSWHALRECSRAHLAADASGVHGAGGYNVLQRVTYLLVVFVMLPAVVWTGLAMSPAFTAVMPWSVDLLGGHQSARTLHFVAMLSILAFTVVHVAMIARTGFVALMRSMITGTGDTRA